MLFLLAFFFLRFSLVARRFKFHFTSSRCTGILRLYGQSLSRLTGISVASTGTLGRPGLHINGTGKITVNYLQAETSRYTGII